MSKKNITDLARSIMEGKTKTLSEGADPLENVNDLGPAIVHPLQSRGKDYGSGVSGGKDGTIPGSSKPGEKYNPTNKDPDPKGDVKPNVNSKDHTIPGSEKPGEKFDPTNKGKGDDKSGNPADGPTGGKGKGEPYNPTHRTQSVKEEILSELSKNTLSSYVKKAASDRSMLSPITHSADTKGAQKKRDNRRKGVSLAFNKLTKEDVEAIMNFIGGEINEENLEALDANKRNELLSFFESLEDGTSLLEVSKDDDDDDDDDKDDSKDKDDDKDDDGDKADKFKKLKEAREAADRAIAEHVDAMLSGENLTEEFQKKAKTIFEAAVAEREAVLREEIEAEFAGKLEEAIEEIKTDLEAKVDDYMSYCAKEWLKENELAVESSTKVQLSDDFLNGLRSLFIEHHINIPTEKVDVVEELSSEVEELEGKLNEEIAKNVEVQKEVSELRRERMVIEACAGLTTTQASKVMKLVEGISAETDDEFKSKLSTIVESYTGTKPPVGKTVVEDKDPASNEKKEEVDNPMSKYVSAAKRHSPWQKL
jgi:hypothetical protein